MTTRTIPGLGVTAFALSAVGIMALAQVAQTQDKGHHSEHGGAMEACAKACSDCQRMCDSCANHCGLMLSEGKKDHLTTLMTCQDCAAICSAAAQIVSRIGPFSELVCVSCADACSRCGKECEKFNSDEHMKRCAEECRKCEKACRDMVKHLATK